MELFSGAGALAKLPLILVDTYFAHRAVSSPTPPAAAEEEQRFIERGKAKDGLSSLGGWRYTAFKTIFHAMTIPEVYLMLAEKFPMLRESSIIKLLSPHLPFDTLASKIRVTPTFLVGSALLITGSLIRIACYRTLGRQFTFSLSLQKEHKLITNGPYSIVRHPSYLGTAIYNVGHILVQMGSGSWWRESGIGSTTIGRVLGLGRVGFSAFIVLMLWMRIPSEDLVMKNEFGEQWEAWTKKTPYKLVPGIY